MDEEVGHTIGSASTRGRQNRTRRFRNELIVLIFAAIIFLGGIVSPPSLMDDVDAVQAQIGRNMLDSGDWVTARLNGVAYLEKSPMKYWLIAISFKIFGVHDWAARLPIALAAVSLCWLTTRVGCWAFSEAAGLYSGLVLTTCAGLFLFTRVLIPDVTLTLTITLAMWAFLRALDRDEARPRLWAAVMAGSIGTGLLLKGLIAAVFPIAAIFFYLVFTKTLTDRETWRRLHVFSGVSIALLIAAPWHVLATLRNPPYFYWGVHSGPAEYHGFFWFYFMNEHVLRFLNLRYPRDYNTVPRLWFWLFHLLWLFPWSVFFPGIARLSYRAAANSNERGANTRLLALCWTSFILIFFTFSSTQEYYSMPCYPALALLLGCVMATDDSPLVRYGNWIVAVIAGTGTAAIVFILARVWSLPTPGDISSALTQHPENYTLSLGHMGDLTLDAFAYLRGPLMLAGLAFLVGAIGLAAFRSAGQRPHAFLTMAAMMALFLTAARMALVTFDPYLSSRPLATALLRAAPGQLIEDNAYYTFSSVFFYTNRTALLLHGRQTNLEYGSYAPDAPKVFIEDPELKELWASPERYYLLVEGPAVPRIAAVVGKSSLHIGAESGGKILYVNHPNIN